MVFPVDIQFVKRAESKLGRKLPLGYTARMCRDNGGEVRIQTDCWQLFPIFDDSDRKRLKRTCNDIVQETTLARAWSNFPSNALAIGDNGSGDKLVLLPDVKANRFGDAVYWWDHETGQVHQLADGFEELSRADSD